MCPDACRGKEIMQAKSGNALKLKPNTMIRFRINQLMEERGIKKPRIAPLVKLGISHEIVKKYLNGSRSSIDLEHIEKLCHFLRCTPNDLFEWEPDNKLFFDGQHPIQQIKKKPPFSLMDAVSKMTPDEIKKKFEQ
jgi:DNA-binding Xre family transcriptional regulator